MVRFVLDDLVADIDDLDDKETLFTLYWERSSGLEDNAANLEARLAILHLLARIRGKLGVSESNLESESSQVDSCSRANSPFAPRPATLPHKS